MNKKTAQNVGTLIFKGNSGSENNKERKKTLKRVNRSNVESGMIHGRG
jgi:hypothetical protein